MSVVASNVINARSGQTTRREQILDAAEACFVRNGFHRTTMQDLSREAGMTAGNFYHYFRSKEALVLGLAKRERERGALLVERLEQDGDRRAAIFGIFNRYFVAMPRVTAVLRLEIWSEATRNPDIAAMTEESEAETRTWFIETFRALATSPNCDPSALYAIVRPLMKGLIVDRALQTAYDPAGAIEQLCGLIDAGLAGRLPASCSLNEGVDR
jgi:AcrR family transcriptional regulator